MTYSNIISSYPTTSSLQAGTNLQKSTNLQAGTANAALFQSMLQSHKAGTTLIQAPSAMPTASSGVSFGQVPAHTSGTSTDAVIAEMESMGVVVTVRAVPNNPEALRSLANSAGGCGNVFIAPNILEDMANDTEIRQNYLGKISDWLSGRASCNAMLGAMGMRCVHSSMVIHEDGSVTYNSMTESGSTDEEDDDERKRMSIKSIYDPLWQAYVPEEANVSSDAY